MIYSRYNSPDSILSLSWDYGMDMLKKATEKDTERYAWELWLTFPEERKQKLPFAEYLRKVKEPTRIAEKRTDEEVIKDAEDILQLMKRT